MHVYGLDSVLWTISPGLTVTQKATGSLEDWARRTFGAQQIEPMKHSVGTVADGVWRPGLTLPGQIQQALDASRSEQRSAEQSLYLLISALNDLFLYVDPKGAGVDAYGAKTRELLILACTEVEDGWTQYLRRAGVPPGRRAYSTNDYVQLKDPLRLAEYEISLVPYEGVPKIRPFERWDPAQPTQSLAWYDTYNKAKHDRSANLHLATVTRCVEAVAAAVIMFCARYGPFSLYNESTPVASLTNHLFGVELADADPTCFYAPLVAIPRDAREDLVCWSSAQTAPPWTVVPLTL